MNGLILDVIVVVIAVLLIIFGLWRGMYKLIFGLISGIAALVLAIVLASTVTSFVIDKTNVDDWLLETLDEQVQGVIPAEIDASNVDITFNTDGTIVIAHGTDVYDTVSAYLEGTPYSMLGGILDSVVSSKNTQAVLNPSAGEEGAAAVTTTLAQVLSTAAIVYILLAAVFIILWILSYIIVRLIMFLIKKLVHGTYIGHFVDKLLGLVVGAAFAMVLIWGVLAVVRLLGTYTFILPVNELINSSTVTKLLYEHNFLYDFLVKSTNLQETIAGLIGRFAGTGESSGAAETAANIAARLSGVAAKTDITRLIG